MMGLTTHVLDTASGRPAAGVEVRLYLGTSLIARKSTNSDGRCDGPLIAGEAFVVGAYRLEFEIGGYFRSANIDLPSPAFLETVVITFGVADASAHYHVPLLVSPFGYSTYRGS